MGHFPSICRGTSGGILKALIFTGTFGVGSLVAATILEYENTRRLLIAKARKAKLNWLFKKPYQGPTNTWQKFKNDCKRIWEQLTPGSKVFVPLCALNVLVYGAWQINSLDEIMMQYFCSNPASKAICWPMFLSIFSHCSLFHLIPNMYVLSNYVHPGVMSLGKEQFLAVFLTGGVVANLSSIIYKILLQKPGFSLGASGAILAIVSYLCFSYPDIQLSIIFMPAVTFSAEDAIKIVMIIDFAGCLLQWDLFDHADHLGGCLFGLFWAHYGAHIWQKRLPYVNIYHDLRRRIKSR